jgi:hypothetical protein
LAIIFCGGQQRVNIIKHKKHTCLHLLDKHLVSMWNHLNLNWWITFILYKTYKTPLQQQKSFVKNTKRSNLNWKFTNCNLNTHIFSWNMDINPLFETIRSQIPPGAFWENYWKLSMEF